MFHFASSDVPATAEALRDEIQATLHRLFILPAGRVALSGEYPHLQELAIDLDGATLRTDVEPQPPKMSGQKQEGPTVRRLSMHGRPMQAQGAQFQLLLEAQEVRFVFDRDQQGRLLMLPEEVKAGTVEASIERPQLEMLLMSGANAALGKAVNITAVAVDLRQVGQRSLAFEARVTAKKLISTVVAIQGQVDIDQALVARASGLSCRGDGMVGKAVSGLLGPHLRKLEGRELPLMGLSLGQVRLRDVQVEVGDGMRARGWFASR